jgi:two-component system sensor histidine kinase KdpD
LAAIMASATSLHEFGDSFDPPTRQDLSATIQEEALRLDACVANLLHMSRLEGGALAIARAPFSVSEVIVRAVAVRTRGGRSGVQLSLAPRLAEAHGDPILFEQAFGNVFENALRYAPAASPILVRADRRGEAIRVEVLDEGPGVPDEELPRIFEKFYRARGAGQKAGTGLGLAIARGLMEAMGGTIAARNRPDRPGLSVTIELPVAP